MALSIGVGVGSKIDVDGHLVQVKSISQPNLIIITVDGGPEIVVTAEDKKIILDGVGVQVGVGKNGGTNRLAFEAPRNVRINRIESERRK